MPSYYPTVLLRPKNVQEAISHLQKWGPSARLIAGNTTIYELGWQGALSDVQCLIDMSGLGLSYVRDDSSVVRIGATTTFRELAESPLLVGSEYVALTETVARITSPQIRNAGTVGGSICSGIPFYDIPTTLLALGAQARVASPSGERVVRLDEFFIDYFVTCLSPDDVVVEVEVPHSTNTGTSFVKIGRTLADFAVVNAAAQVQLDSARRKIVSARVALGGVAGTPVRAGDVEGALKGNDITKSVVLHAAGQTRNIDPTPSVQASSEYKRTVLPIIVRDALIIAIERAGGGLKET